MLRAKNYVRPLELGTGVGNSASRRKNSRHGTHERKPARDRRLLFDRLEDRLVLSGSSTPVVEDLALLHDTGASASDGITTDRRVEGWVRDSDSVSFLLVEFDHNADGVADGQARSDMRGRFEYRPDGVSVGAVTIRARAGEDGGNPGENVFGSWSSFSFNLESDLNDAAPTVAAFGLAFDTGATATDGITADPTVTGTIINAGDVANLIVQFDLDGDDVADGTSRTDGAGQFSYRPHGLAAGTRSVRTRAGEWSPGAAVYQYSDWASASFTLDQTANLAPQLASLQLLRDTLESSTDGITTDPRLTGAVTNDGALLVFRQVSLFG